jgi:hypothetical protein
MDSTTRESVRRDTRPGGAYRRLHARLIQPVDGASLAVFRIAFGALMLWDVVLFFDRGWIKRYFIDPPLRFTYVNFEWVQSWPGDGMYIHFALMGVAAVALSLGLMYRTAAVAFGLLFTYQFLIEQTLYLNHFYAISLITLCLAIVPAHAVWSIDRLRTPPSARTGEVPTWAVWLVRFQVGLIYFFGGIAKLNADWLNGDPMGQWARNMANRPIVGFIVDHGWEVPVFSYGGLLLDLLVVPGLLWARTRPFAFAAAVCFHLMNSQLFNIGVFPWMTIAATTIFFAPDWPRRIGAILAERPYHRRPAMGAGAPLGTAAVLGLCAYVAAQCLIPFRHLLYPGNVAWTEEGHMFSWRMMLRQKAGTVQYRIVTPTETTTVNAVSYLAPHQSEALTRPEMMLQLAHYLADQRRRDGDRTVKIYADARVSLNGRPPAPIIDPTVDLAAEQRSLSAKSWILPAPRTPSPSALARQRASHNSSPPMRAGSTR